MRCASVVAIVGSLLLCAALSRAADAAKDDEPYAPHTPTLIFYLTGADGQKDVDAISGAISKLKSASTTEVNTSRSYVRVRFDSHVVSYHQVAQAISDAGKSIGKKYDPWLIFIVADYAKGANAEKVDEIFAGKRLNTRVTVKPLDKGRGEFMVHFLPLVVDPKISAPQGFNGGHLHHPISDPAPRGLALESSYADRDILGTTSRPAN
jgi:copper chaperone CopZ